MPSKLKWYPARILFGLFFVLNSVIASAQPSSHSASITELALDAQWLKLGHYRANWLGPGYHSEVDDAEFFVAPTGHRDPIRELEATLEALSQTQTATSPPIYCRFPARALWLHRRLPQIVDQPDLAQCPQLSSWRERVPVGSITLIFPSSYINSPASMFGHTLLRIDPPASSAGNDLLSWALNYGANADAAADGGLLYAYRGLTGGYHGSFNLVPYYEKVRQYNDIDNRDIFEYRLNLDKSEVEFLLLHAWELKGMQFEYYYIDENCAYQLLTLLDVARPQANLANQFVASAIPADTVAAIIAAGMVEDYQLRPSAKTEFNQAVAPMTEAQQQLTRTLVNEFDNARTQIRQRPENEQLWLLDSAYRYSRLLANEQQQHQEMRDLSYELLREISALPSAETPAAAVDITPTEAGHHSKRWGAQLFHSSSSAGGSGLLLAWRGAYHDWLDPLPGFTPGANIELLDGSVLLHEDTLKLQYLSIAQVQSLRVVDDFFNPTSWFAGGGLWRDPLLAQSLEGYIHTGRGKTVAVADTLFYGLGGARYATHWGLMPGVRFGWVKNGTLSLNLEFNAHYSFVRDTPVKRLKSEMRLHINRQFSWMARYDWHQNRALDEETLSLGFYHFF